MAAGDVARAFHGLTKHTPESIRRPGWTMDWSNKPHPFKSYEDDLERVVPDDPLAHILRFGAGVLRKADVGGEIMYFRTYASAGALYPVEVYVADASGVFHFDPLRKDLERLRGPVGVGSTYVVLTGIPWRTCWKYGNRGYRHLFWDAGTILANVLALAASHGLDDARVDLAFDDHAVANLIGVDGTTEFALCIVALEGAEPLEVPDVEPLGVRSHPLSARAIRFERLEEVHAAGRLASAGVPTSRGERAGPAPSVDLGPDVERVIRRRGSARRLGPRPIPLPAFEAMLTYGAQPPATDHGGRFLRVFAAVHAVDDLPAGTYVWENGTLRRLWRRDVRLDAAYLCLEQRLGGEGAATLFLMSDLEGALERFGDRGYRVAQLEGGVALGRLDLAAHAHGIGATGLTFYDDEVRGFLLPAAKDLDCIVVCAIGERKGRLLALA